jgi:hypothetical protein
MDMNMETKDIIKKIMDDLTPTEYPDLFSRGDVENAIRKALDMQSGKVKKLEKQVSDAGWQYEYDHRDDWRKPTEMGTL